MHHPMPLSSVNSIELASEGEEAIILLIFTSTANIYAQSENLLQSINRPAIIEQPGNIMT
jgi:hypothetical protein